jgi:hypothetical protein
MNGKDNIDYKSLIDERLLKMVDKFISRHRKNDIMTGRLLKMASWKV